MNQEFQDIHSFARLKLEPTRALPPSERLCVYRQFLKLQNQRLLYRHRAGDGGMEVAYGRRVVMDELLICLLQNCLADAIPRTQNDPSRPNLCLIATGGYGRGELNPHSDVDLLFLLPETDPSALAPLQSAIEQVLYALWDLNFKIGHATRTLPECMAQCEKDSHCLTALMESRHLGGPLSMFQDLREAVIRHCSGRRARSYVAERLHDQVERHRQHGNSVFVQEPNVKNGCGGLRDLHTLLWIARALRGIGALQDLAREGLLSSIEAGEMSRAQDFLMRVRNELHYTNGRETDQVVLSAQPSVAEALGYHQRDVLDRIEIFMRHYYRHARAIHLLTRALAERLAIETPAPAPIHKHTAWLTFESGRKPIAGGLVLENDLLECAPGSSFPEDPHDLLQVFRLAQLHQARIGFGLQSRIRQNLHSIDREFLYSKRARDIFISILDAKGEVGRILRAMHECGVLGKYIPEFGKLDCLVQHEFYHRYTADEHTLLTLEELDAVLNAARPPAALYSRIFQRLENAHILYLALLLHDTGKSSHTPHHTEASAECAQHVARRFCLDPEARRILIWLVDHHITMSRLIHMRDIDDPATIRDFCQIAGSSQNLDMLHLMTFADTRTVSDTFQNEWRQSLFWQLYNQTFHALNHGAAQTDPVQDQRQRLRQETTGCLPQNVGPDEAEAHFASMPPRYWRCVTANDLLWHLNAIHTFFSRLINVETEIAPPSIQWRHFPDSGHSEVVICTWDRHGLFAKIAGSFAATRINILSAEIYTRSDNVVLDIFRVCDLEHHSIRDEHRLIRFTDILTKALARERPVSFTELIRKEYESMRRKPCQEEERFPTSIVFDNEDSAEHTILEIQTPDRLGLLYQILNVLAHCGLNISLARINTLLGAATDVFYLRDNGGRKITDPRQIDILRQKLRETIDLLNKPFRPS
ncbi:MAG: [protein-PII] uridylyltransferase [Verrucomicrobiae bacterium]|nr:[protein-PII] uridylyltransferase [Verrucomicrobiae bacterium]